jgi:hypothetical protein
MVNNFKHCIIDFESKIVKAYDNEVHFKCDPITCTYLMDVTIIHEDNGIRILGSEVDYVHGKYYVNYDNQITKFIIPKDTFIFKYTTIKK